MSEQSFIHCDNSNEFLTLHDCIAERAYICDGKLVFEFPDGFYISAQHPDNPYGNCLLTDAARVEFVLEDSYGYHAYAWLFVRERKKNSKKTVRYWDLDLFMKKVNSGMCKFEFTEHYMNTQNPFDNVICGCLRGNKKLSFCECWMRIYATKINYYWNNLCPDRPW